MEKQIMKHTPGPWEVMPSSIGNLHTGQVEPCFDVGQNDEELACAIMKEADACLIAAAPELLAMAKVYRDKFAKSVEKMEDLAKVICLMAKSPVIETESIRKAHAELARIDSLLAKAGGERSAS